jgi:hypothetical protein
VDEHDFHVGKIVRIKQDEDVIAGLPSEYKEITGHTFEVVKVTLDYPYPIGTKDLEDGSARNFKTSEIELHNSLLSDVKKESKKF